MGRVLAGSYRVFMFLEILKIKAKLWANISQSKKSKKDNTALPLFKILPADARHPPTHPLNSNLRLTLLSLTDFLFIVVYQVIMRSARHLAGRSDDVEGRIAQWRVRVELVLCVWSL